MEGVVPDDNSPKTHPEEEEEGEEPGMAANCRHKEKMGDKPCQTYDEGHLLQGTMGRSGHLVYKQKRGHVRWI